MAETEARPDLRPINIDALADPMWSAFVEAERSDVFHSPPWLRVLANTYGFEPRAAMLVAGDSRPVAGLPYCLVDGLPARRIATPPFSDYCDPIVDDEANWERLLDSLLAEERTVSVRCLHNDIPLRSSRMALVNRAKWHAIDVALDVDELWSGLHASARRAVRKARNENVVVRPATDSAELRAFFELHLRIRKHKYRLLAQPYRFFENIWDEFVAAGRGSLMLALHEDRLVAGVYFLEWRDTLYYKFNASDPASIAIRPNDMIMWTAVEMAKSRGLKRIDLGLSDWDQEGLIRYKQKYASEEKTISFLRTEPDGAESAAAGQIRAILPRLTELLTAEDVPDAATERAGDLLYRLFA